MADYTPLVQRFFASSRERRLWIWAAAAVVAIYSTLGLAGSLAGALGTGGLLSVAFGSGALLVLVTIVTQGFESRPGGAEIGVALGIGTAYLMVFVRIANPAERTHLVEYGVVAALVYEALEERVRCGRRVPALAPLAAAVTMLVGALDECIQALLPSRVFDPRDILFNLLASVMAVAAITGLRWARSNGRVQGPDDPRCP